MKLWSKNKRVSGVFVLHLKLAFVCFFSSLLFCSVAEADDIRRPAEWRRGYVDEIAEEREQKTEEMILIPEPPKQDTDIQKYIFDESFSQDMTERYERRFGFTAVEQNLDAPNRFEEVEYFTQDNFGGIRVTFEEDVERKGNFGNFMLRKLAEYHADIYFKSNPSTKAIYEAKDKYSATSVQFGGGFKLRAKYSLSGQEFKFRLKNPYKMRLELVMEVGDNGQGNLLRLGKTFDNGLNVDTYYNFDQDDFTFVASKKIKRYWLMTFTVGSNLDFIDQDNPVSDERRVLMGIQWRP